MAQKKPKQGAEYVLSPHLGLLMPITNSVKAGKNAYKKPKTDSSILGSIYSLHRTQLRLEKLCIQLCHQNIYFVHDDTIEYTASPISVGEAVYSIVSSKHLLCS